jgi:adenine/guanine phosphoribosyltransferase-like PRPP-binding protein
MLREIVKPTADRYADLLRPNPDYPAGSRDASDDRFHVTMGLSGESVMLIDDQWTSGSRAQSAASALKVAGAGPVAIVVLGRHFDRKPDREDYGEAASAYYSAVRMQGWAWTACCLRGPHDT